jgi:hypothetical protein
MKLAEETYGQARHMTITEGQGINAEEHGHWYSPSAAAQFIADEREVCDRQAERSLTSTGSARSTACSDFIRKRPNV